MAFDFLGNLFRSKTGKKKEPQKAHDGLAKKEKQHLEPANILEWLNSHLAKEIESERKEFSAMSGELLQLIKDLRKNVDNIRQKSFEAGDRTYAAVNMIKDTWTKKALMSFNSYNREVQREMISPESIEFPAFRDIFHNTTRLMNEMTMIPRQKLVLSRYFERESKRMADILNSIGTIMDSMKSAVSGSGPLKSVDRIRKMIDQMASQAEETERIGKSIEASRSGIAAKEKEIEDLARRISSIGKSPEWKELHTLDKNIEDSLERKDEIEREVAEKLSSMKRVFKLYAHDAAELGKDERKVMLDLSHSPLKTFLARDAESIENALNKLGKDIGAGQFSLSKKDAGKTGELRHILESGWIPKARSEYDRTQADAAAYKAKRGGIKVMVEKREAERMLEKCRADLEILRRQESDLEKRLKEKKGEMKEKKSEISDFVRDELGPEVQID